MSERRFYLQEIFREGVGWDSPSTITESELKRRLACIADVDESLIRESIIDILLHGEGKEKPTEYIVGKCQECGRDIWSDDQAACPHDKRIKKSQPDPWEEWVEEMPTWFSIILSYGKKEHPTAIRELKDWFRTMPRGK